jgi:hypothetical protein
MQELSVIRGWQFDLLRKSLASVRFILENTEPEALTVYRDGGDGWTAVEVLCHLRDFEEVFLNRAIMTMQEDYPPLPFPDPDGLAEERQYNMQPVWSVYDQWATFRGQFLDFLQAIESEVEWERAGQHPKRGRFSLNDQLILTGWHDMNHIEQMTRTLAEKRS